MSPTDVPADYQSVAIELLRDLVVACSKALKSLIGRVPETLVQQANFCWARQINDAADGFVALRNQGLVAGAKLLVRPAIEAVFRLRAVMEKPEMIYSILYSEAKGEDKWAGRLQERHGAPPMANLPTQEWREFRARCVNEFGEDKVKDTHKNLRDVAREGKMEHVYDTYYGLYCQHTHGSLRAPMDGLDEVTTPVDTRTMILCSMDALRALCSLGAVCPDFPGLNERWNAFARRLPIVTKSE
jgi:hypothetical protein